MINLINEQNDIDKIYLYTRDLSESKYEYLIEKREDAGIKHLNNPNAFTECSITTDDVYENINDYNPVRKGEKLIVFDDMITDIMVNKKFQVIIKKLFIRYRKLNISLVFITQFCSKGCNINYRTLFNHENKWQKRITKYWN